mgnify:CR=1 FL=1|jgi:hypothetical protein
MLMQLSTNSRRAVKVFDTTPTATTTVPTAASSEPSGAGVLDCRDLNIAKILFYGTGAEKAFDALVYGWAPVVGSDLWIPTLICKVACTTSTNAKGVVGQPVTSTDYFVDSIVFTNGDDTVKISTGIDDTVASLTVDLEGASYVQVGFVDGLADSYNALVALL